MWSEPSWNPTLSQASGSFYPHRAMPYCVRSMISVNHLCRCARAVRTHLHADFKSAKNVWNCLHNWKVFRTVLKLFCFSPKTPLSWKVLAVLANHCRYTLFERQTRGEGGAMTYAWRRRSQCWIVARYCNALLFGVAMRVTRYILPKVTHSITCYFYRNY